MGHKAKLKSEARERGLADKRSNTRPKSENGE